MGSCGLPALLCRVGIQVLVKGENGGRYQGMASIPLVELGCKLSALEMGRCSRNLICDLLCSLRDATGQLLGHNILSHSMAYRPRFFAPVLRNLALQSTPRAGSASRNYRWIYRKEWNISTLLIGLTGRVLPSSLWYKLSLCSRSQWLSESKLNQGNRSLILMAARNKKALSSCSKQKEQFSICRLYLRIQMRICYLKCPFNTWDLAGDT